MDTLQEHIIKILKKHTKLKEIPLEIPPDSTLGDYAFPCFILAKKLKKNPQEIAQELASALQTDDIITEIRAAGPYVNFFVNKETLSADVLQKILKEKEKYGQGEDKNKTYMMEYFHANTHKGLHIGHIRNVALAEALCRTLEKTGYKVIRANYQGDIGPHVATCIWGYLHLGKKEPKKKRGTWLGQIYSLASKKASNKKVEEEIRKINNKLYAKDKELMQVWKKTRQWCLDDFDDFYKEFDVKFDRLYFESEVEEPGKEIIAKMLKKGLAEESEGAIIINLEKYDLGVYVLLTGDGNALYSTKDLGLAQIKQKEYTFDKSIHVTGAEQKLHFQQLFKTLEIIGSPMAKKSLHIPYGLVLLPEGKMSSRTGTIILFEELQEKLFSAAKKAIQERHKDLSKKEIEDRTKKIAYGALKFSMINRENNRDVVFDWDKALSFEGETGPYIQYTYARINSILKKHKGKVDDKADVFLLHEKEELDLIMLVSQFEDIVQTAAEQHKIHLLGRYLLDVSQAFNNFYHAYPVLKAEKDLKQARLVLITCVQQVLQNGLYLLGIDTLEQM